MLVVHTAFEPVVLDPRQSASVLTHAEGVSSQMRLVPGPCKIMVGGLVFGSLCKAMHAASIAQVPIGRFCVSFVCAHSSKHSYVQSISDATAHHIHTCEQQWLALGTSIAVHVVCQSQAACTHVVGFH